MYEITLFLFFITDTLYVKTLFLSFCYRCDQKLPILSKVGFQIRFCFSECRQTYIGKQKRAVVQATNQAKNRQAEHI
ncbi:MAG: hypothetical protein ACK53Y_12560, partial [bacterium]